MERDLLMRELRRPQAYGSAEEIGLIQTHVSMLFFTGERVYKVKKAVDLGFLDFTSLARRKEVCEDEVRLNRRLAPEVYLGVVPVHRGSDGHLRVGGEPSGEVVEWAVEMVRLPAERMLDALLERGEIDNAVLDAVVELLVPFHAAAATGAGVDEHGSPASVRRNAEENFEALEPFVGNVAEGAHLSRSLFDFLRERSRGFLDTHAELLERRVREGRIREGHGDLHAGNLCVREGGIVAYDCLEFAPRFRCSDVAAELAFLCMDLGRRGYPAFAAYLAHRYAERTGDAELRRLLPFYSGYRALVRAKVTALGSKDRSLEPEERAEQRRESIRYVQLAAGYELPPALVLLCGLPGTGKSFLARDLARSLGAALFSSDVRRKILTGRRPGDSAAAPPGAGLYAPKRRDATYRSLLGSAVRTLRAGHSAVIDATFTRRARRSPFVDAATRLDLPWFLVHVTADEELVRARLARREEGGHSTSDAGLRVYLSERKAFEPPDELPSGHVVEARSEADPLELVGARLTDVRIAIQRGA